MELIFKNHFFNKKKMNYKGFSIWYLNDFEIGRSYFKMNINENWDSVIYVQTWGSDEHFYWEKGAGKVEIYIDDFKVSESLFRIDDQKEYLLPSKEKIPQKSFQENKVSDITIVESEKENLQKLLAELNNFVGLKNIKNSIKDSNTKAADISLVVKIQPNKLMLNTIEKNIRKLGFRSNFLHYEKKMIK